VKALLLVALLSLTQGSVIIPPSSPATCPDFIKLVRTVAEARDSGRPLAVELALYSVSPDEWLSKPFKFVYHKPYKSEQELTKIITKACVGMD